MNKHICIHGHFYQPPRENPWLEAVELQDSAYPYHDWNARVTAQCYAPNAAARQLNEEKKIFNLSNNYSRMSFNFGPTLLSWLALNDQETYQAVLQADKDSIERFKGHGSALAQCYSHLIMPLADREDKETQVLWGLRDFEFRFHRKPEGMWLPETAVDIETLEVLADAGIAFTVLAPHQARAVRRTGEEDWEDVSGGRVDIRRAYRCLLPSGKSIALFFYDGPVSRALAFENLLDNGEEFYQRLTGLLGEEDGEIVHLATDGETYGHHHEYGEMALAFCLNRIEETPDLELINYGLYLEEHPPEFEVMIEENTSWSCMHGLERWRSACGCQTGGQPGWQQEWRAPLREAMDWLRDRAKAIYREEAGKLFRDPQRARAEYIELILRRGKDGTAARPAQDRFLSEQARERLDPAARVRALKLLEMQRNAMLMFTSCGWFFSEISGIETVQIMSYAARVIQLAQEVAGQDPEPEYIEKLQAAASNIPRFNSGADVYREYVQPMMLDLLRVGAHYAVSSLFEDYEQDTRIYSYQAVSEGHERLTDEVSRLSLGKAGIRSEITGEEAAVTFAVFYAGGHHLLGGVREFQDDGSFGTTAKSLKKLFEDKDFERLGRQISEEFTGGQYSFKHLFRDEQRKVLYQVLDEALINIEQALRRVNDFHQPIFEVAHQLRVPLPKIMTNTLNVMFNTDLMQALAGTELSMEYLRQLVQEVVDWNLDIDRVTVAFVVQHRLEEFMGRFRVRPQDVSWANKTRELLEVLRPLNLKIELWRVQNLFFQTVKDHGPNPQKSGPLFARFPQNWMDDVRALGDLLNIHVDPPHSDPSPASSP